MPNKKISQLNSVEQLFGDEKLLITQSGANKTSTVPVLGTKLNSDVGAAVSGLNSQSIGFSGNARASITGIGSDLAASIGALHRSPNAITSMFVYDTSKDSDGGAWTEKCQHTSWYNETLSGKWLGAHQNDVLARYHNSIRGPEIFTRSGTYGGGFSSTADAALFQNGTFDSVNGTYTVSTGAGVYHQYAYTQLSGERLLTVGKTYVVEAVVKSATTVTHTPQILVSSTFLDASTYGLSSQFIVSSQPQTIYCYFTALTADPIVRLYAGGQNATTVYDSISIKEVTVTNTKTGDYFQLTTDGKFYKMWKNLLKYSQQINSTNYTNGWAGGTIYANSTTAPDGSLTASTLVPNSGSAWFGKYNTDAVQVYSGQTYTISVYAKAAGVSSFGLSGDVRDAGGLDASATFTLTGVGTSTVSGSGTAGIQQLANGWYRCWLTQVCNSTQTEEPAVTLTNTNTIDGIYLWGAQLEYGTTATTYEAKGAEGPTSEVFRGNKREFPKLSAIVAEAANVTIYDLTEPSRPMWMRFLQTASQSRSFFPSNASVTSIVAANGVLCIGISGGSQAGLSGVEFIKDTLFRYDSITDRGGYGSVPISNRTTANLLGYTLMVIANRAVNAVAMTVLPDAPVDPVTGLQVPTIAVATAGGVSVIKHNGTVVSSTTASVANYIGLKPNILTVFNPLNSASYYSLNPGSLGANFVMTARNSIQPPDFQLGTTDGAILHSRTDLIRKSGARIQKLKSFESDISKSPSATITNTYNTGHMIGDIRRTYLSDVDAGSVSGVDLGWPSETLSVSSFSSNAGWDISDLGDRIRITRNSNAYTGTPALYSAPVVAGRLYAFSFSFLTVSSGATGFYTATNGGAEQLFGNAYPGAGSFYIVVITSGNGNGTALMSFSAARGATPANALAGDYIEMSKTLSILPVIRDRSYKAQVAPITGTITKSPVATGSQLVAYSGFSA